MSSKEKMAIDIDDLNNIDNPVVLDARKTTPQKDFPIHCLKLREKIIKSSSQNSQEVDDLMATIPPDVAEKFKDLKDTLEMIDTKKPDNAKS